MFRSLFALAACLFVCGSAFAGDITAPPNNIPEPGIVALIAMGAGGILLARRKAK